eukprot:jgi/Astpho2/3740/e_gw1.00060.39.1_t
MLVDPECVSTLMELLQLTLTECGWHWSSTPQQELEGKMQEAGYDPRLTHHCLQVFGTELEPGTWAFDTEKICIHHAKQMFKREPNWPLHEFMATWQTKVMEGMEPDIDMLAGEALMVTGGAYTTVVHFPVSAMPCQPAARFAMLFERQPRWQWEHLKPYLKGLQAPGLSAEALLLKYARKSQTDPSASMFYTAR